MKRAQFKKLVEGADCPHANVYKAPSDAYAFISFTDEASREKTRAILEGFTHKGRTFTVKDAKPPTDAAKLRRHNIDHGTEGGAGGAGGEGGQPSAKRQRTKGKKGGGTRGVCFDFQKGTCERGGNCRFSHGGDDDGEEKSAEAAAEAAAAAAVPRTIQDAVTPLWNMPYAVQLEDKQKSIMQILKKVPRQVKKEFLKKVKNRHRMQHGKRGKGSQAATNGALEAARNVVFPAWMGYINPHNVPGADRNERRRAKKAVAGAEGRECDRCMHPAALVLRSNLCVRVLQGHYMCHRQHWGDCRVPSAFLSFCLGILMTGTFHENFGRSGNFRTIPITFIRP